MAENRRLRIFHCGDIHLDTPFSRLDMRRGEIRRQELRGVFTSIMLFLRANKVDICLMPGDLFDDGFATRATAALMQKEFAACPSCRFVIAPGNHDPYRTGSVYEADKFPDNVYIFKKPTVSRFEFPELGADVYGWAFTSQFMRENPLADFTPENNGRLRLLCAHCDTTSAVSPSCPVNEGDIVRCGFDYAALGHIHKTEGIKKRGTTLYGYSGSPEGRSFDECGKRGAYCTDFFMNGDATVHFEEFSRRIYAVNECDLSGCVAPEEATERASALFAREKYGEKTLLRLTLRGDVSPSLTLEGVRALGDRLFSLELVDATAPTFEGKALINDITLRGALYRRLLPELQSDDEKVRRIAADALRYGLCALSGGTPGEL